MWGDSLIRSRERMKPGSIVNFLPNADGGGYVGLDIAHGYVMKPVTYTPGPASSSSPISVALERPRSAPRSATRSTATSRLTA